MGGGAGVWARVKGEHRVCRGSGRKSVKGNDT